MKKKKPTPIIIIDSRENKPFFIDKKDDPTFPGLQFQVSGLHTGDYSILGMELPACSHCITIERKSLSDLFGSMGSERVRFESEFIRMAMYDYAALVIENDFRDMILNPPIASAMNPKSVFRTILAWSQRYGVHVFACPSREFAERTTFILLNRFWDDRQPGGKMEFSKI